MEGVEMEVVPMSLRLASWALLIGFTNAVQAGGFSNMEHAAQCSPGPFDGDAIRGGMSGPRSGLAAELTPAPLD
jgi:hypothetical protein